MAKRALDYDDIFRLKEATQPSLAADGVVAFVLVTTDEEADENRSSIWSVGANSEPKQLTRGPNDSTPRWAPDGLHLAFLRRTDGPPQIWLLPAAGGEARKLTTLPLGASNFAWSPDSTRLAVLAPVDLDGEPTDEDRARRATAPHVIRSSIYKSDGTGLFGNRRVHLFVVDAMSGDATALIDGDINASGPAWSPDGARVAFAASTSDRAVAMRTHLLVAASAGGSTPDEIARWEGTAASPFFDTDGRSVGFVGSDSPGPKHARLYRVPIDGGVPAEIVPGFDRNVMIGGPGYPGAPPRFLRDGRVLFCARDRGCTHVYMASDGTATKILGAEDDVVSGLDASADRIAFVRSSPQIPADIFTASMDGSKMQRLTDLNRELLGEIALHTCEARSFTSLDGREVHGWVMRGDGPGPRPLLVDVHGGPHNAWSPVFDAVHLYHEVLASQGWTILRLNPRGSDGYGEDFYSGVIGGWGIFDEQDFTCAIDALVEEGVADADRLAVCGYSYGGFMTNWLTARTDRFKAAMSGGTVSDLQSIYGTSDFGAWMGAFEHGGELHEARDAFARSSPLSFVEHVTTPTLILHGENDDRCPIGQAEQWFTSLKRLGVDSEFVRYPGASHLFILNGRPSHRADYNRRIVEWMTRHVS